MSILTTFLQLFKYTQEDKNNNVNFNIETALNANWDKIEANALSVSQEMGQKADKNKTITRQNYQLLTGTLANYIKTQIIAGSVYGSAFLYGASDMDGISGFVTWESDSSISGTVFVKIDSVNRGKKYHRTFTLSTAVWNETSWIEQADTDKIDNLFESGAWTPSLSGGTTAGVFTPSSGNIGSFRRSGKIVTIDCWVTGVLTGAVGELILKGLPFNPVNVTNMIIGIASVDNIKQEYKSAVNSGYINQMRIMKNNGSNEDTANVNGKQTILSATLTYQIN